MNYFKSTDELLTSKLFSNIKLNKFQRFQVDNLIKNFDKKLIRDNYLTIKNFITYNIEDDWSLRLKEIKEKYNRDSSSLSSYIIRYGKIEGEKRFNEKLKSTTVTLEYLINKHGILEGNKLYKEISNKKRIVGKDIMIEKYGQIEGANKWNLYLKKWKTSIKKRKDKGSWKNGLTLEECIFKYGEIEGFQIWKKRKEHLAYISSYKYYLDVFGKELADEKWEQYCRKRDYTSLNYFTKQYGEIEGNKKYIERCKLISYYGSLEYYIKKYGEEEGKIRKNEAVIKSFLNHKFKITRYSKISQELFWGVYNKLSNVQKNKCYFAELNNEYMFYVHRDGVRILMTDFKMNNKIIEFNGDYWHSLEEVKKKDEIKNNFLKEKGYDVLIIKESEYLKNKKEIIQTTINFLNS